MRTPNFPRLLATPLISLALLAIASPCCADTLVGLQPQAGSGFAVSRFLPSQQGDVAPAATLSGPATTLTDANSLYFDAYADELWVSDFFGQKIAVFGARDQGSVPPRRSITGPSLGQPRDLAIVGNRTELAVITSSCCISFYPVSASGMSAPIRGIQWGGGSQTQLNNPVDLAYSASRDRLWVADYRSVEGVSQGRVLVFARTASSTAAPMAIIEGPLTGIGGFVAAVAVDEANAELYVLAADAGGDAEAMAISVFGLDQVGDIAPRRRIAGDQTGIVNAADLALDPDRREVSVVSGAYSAQPSLRVFPTSANGDTPPLRVISGANTGTSFGSGWYSAVYVPAVDQVFRDGFEPQ